MTWEARRNLLMNGVAYAPPGEGGGGGGEPAGEGEAQAGEESSGPISFEDLDLNIEGFMPAKPAGKKAKEESNSEATEENAEGAQEVQSKSPKKGADGVPERDPKTGQFKPGQPAKAKPQDAVLDTLKQQGDAIRALLSRPAPQPAPQPQQKAEPQPKAPKFAFSVPSPLIAALRDQENPANAEIAINAMLNGVANAVWGEVQKEVARVIAEVPRHVQSQSQTVNDQTAVMRDFYGTYKELAVVAPLVQQIAGQMAQQVYQYYGSFQWTPQFRDAVAARVKETLAANGMTFAQGQQQQQQQQQEQPPRRRQPFVNGSGARPAITSGKNVIADAINL